MPFSTWVSRTCFLSTEEPNRAKLHHLFSTLRSSTKMSRKRTRSSSNFVPNFTRRTWPRNWSRTSRCVCSTSRWRTLSSGTKFTVPQRRRFCWHHTPSRRDTATTTSPPTIRVSSKKTDYCQKGDYLTQTYARDRAKVYSNFTKPLKTMDRNSLRFERSLRRMKLKFGNDGDGPRYIIHNLSISSLPIIVCYLWARR